jgi:hypothetical protein
VNITYRGEVRDILLVEGERGLLLLEGSQALPACPDKGRMTNVKIVKKYMYARDR